MAGTDLPLPLLVNAFLDTFLSKDILKILIYIPVLTQKVSGPLL